MRLAGGDVSAPIVGMRAIARSPDGSSRSRSPDIQQAVVQVEFSPPGTWKAAGPQAGTWFLVKRGWRVRHPDMQLRR